MHGLKNLSNMNNNITIGITGPESSGKTYLSEYLHNKYDSVLIKEYAREYLGDNNKYTFKDVINIAEEQFNRIKKAQNKYRDKLIIVDTEMTVIKIWLMDKFGEVPEKIIQQVKNQSIDYFLLCKPDLKWSDDPLREDKDRRDYLYSLYEKELQFEIKNKIIIKGKHTDREHIADSLIKTIYTKFKKN